MEKIKKKNPIYWYKKFFWENITILLNEITEKSVANEKHRC